MPELPEVETTRRGIAPHIEGKTITGVVCRTRKLRWPIPSSLKKHLLGQTIDSVKRRGKYLLINTENGTLLIHLGMSGSLHCVPCNSELRKHDHFDLVIDDSLCLRLHDPRRFGAVLWSNQPYQHPLLKSLGPEPLADDFTSEYLHDKSRGRKQSIKQFIMDSKVVVGVGNIYASESLFRAGISPARAAGNVSKPRYERLVAAIKAVLAEAITQGGTTLKDFSQSDGKPGYFKQKLMVYGRDGEPCLQCGSTIKKIVQGQRATYYCPQCQR
jgi:formamidopyrimidine-DNA glycosylase